MTRRMEWMVGPKLAAIVAAMLVVVLGSAGCAHGPPLDLTSEAAAFESFRRLYADEGVPAREVSLVIWEQTPIPVYLYAKRAVVTRSALAGGDARAHIELVSRAAFGGQLRWEHLERAAMADGLGALDAYRAFMALALAHELGHHVRHVYGAAASSAMDEELATIRLEVAILNELTAEGRLEPGVRQAWIAFNRGLLSAIPEAIIRQWKAASPVERRARFDREIAALKQRLGQPDSSDGDAFFVMAGYTLERLDQLEKTADFRLELTNQGLRSAP